MPMRFFDLLVLQKGDQLDYLKAAAVLGQSLGMESEDEAQILSSPLGDQLTLGKSFNWDNGSPNKGWFCLGEAFSNVWRCFSVNCRCR